MSSSDRVAIASRAFCIAIILGLGLVSRDVQALLSLIVIALASGTAIYLSRATPLGATLVITVEAALTGLIIALALPGSLVFLPYLVVLTLIAGLSGGLVGVSAVVVAQFTAIGMIALSTSQEVTWPTVLQLLSPWLATSVGVGFLGFWLAHTERFSAPDEEKASYMSAHRLLTQLRTITRRLSSGLDPVTMASQMLDVVERYVPLEEGGVYVKTDGSVLSPVAVRGVVGGPGPDPTLTDACWLEMEPLYTPADEGGRTFAAFPLRMGSRMVGVVAASMSSRPNESAVVEMMRELDSHTMRLEAALTFDEVRTLATVEERWRLAREIHDGIAQEVASMGYLVDDLLAGADVGEQRARLTALRQEMTRVVSELRLSIFDLRSEVSPETGLGDRLSEYLRHVGAHSKLTVHLTLDEAPARLRRESETQLLRIAQEAITNARKHSDAENLWVSCRVEPPFAQLEIRDDGRGLEDGRPGSFGVKIMKERVERINGELEIHQDRPFSANPGTIVRVTVGQ